MSQDYLWGSTGQPLGAPPGWPLLARGGAFWFSQFLESQIPSPGCMVSGAGTGEGTSDPARSRVLTRVQGHLLGDFLDSLPILPLNPSSLLSQCKFPRIFLVLLYIESCYYFTDTESSVFMNILFICFFSLRSLFQGMADYGLRPVFIGPSS